MKTVDRIIFKMGSKEEYLPGYSENFPYIASYVELDKYPERSAPWHWHSALELFYIEKGALEYFTPQGKQIFPEGFGGLVNSNVLHMTKLQPITTHNISLIHLFDPVFLSGEKGNRIDQKYVMPFIGNARIELISLIPGEPKQDEVLRLLRDSFLLQENEKGYELKLREKLSEIWLKILEIAEEKLGSKLDEKPVYHKANDQIKQMMRYIQEHYPEKLSIARLANAAFLSERGCYRVFRECLHMTPIDYLTSYRLQMACQMLTKGDTALVEISQSCGFGSSSYFGKIFKEKIGCTPLEYRRKWQDNDI